MGRILNLEMTSMDILTIFKDRLLMIKIIVDPLNLITEALRQTK